MFNFSQFLIFRILLTPVFSFTVYSHNKDELQYSNRINSSFNKKQFTCGGDYTEYFFCKCIDTSSHTLGLNKIKNTLDFFGNITEAADVVKKVCSGDDNCLGYT